MSGGRDDFLPLDEALGFTPEDLAANRAGRLSARQVARLRMRNTTGLLAGLVIVLALVGGGLWLAAVGQWLLGGMLVAAGGALFILTRLGRSAVTSEAQAGAVAAVSGPLTLDTREYPNPNGTVTEYRAQVGDEVFVISRDVFIALSETEAAAFTLYYLPVARMVLSGEDVPG